MSDHKYPSKYSNGKLVSPAQYITEIICEKRAKQSKKDLHYRFWLTKEWSAYYRNQIASAHKLLSKYSDVSIVKALNSKGAEKIYSLRAPHLIPIIESEEASLQNRNEKLSMDLQRKDNATFRTNTKDSSANIVSRLKDLDS